MHVHYKVGESYLFLDIALWPMSNGGNTRGPFIFTENADESPWMREIQHLSLIEARCVEERLVPMPSVHDPEGEEHHLLFAGSGPGKGNFFNMIVNDRTMGPVLDQYAIMSTNPRVHGPGWWIDLNLLEIRVEGILLDTRHSEAVLSHTKNFMDHVEALKNKRLERPEFFAWYKTFFPLTAAEST
jgi:hypothetical protein